MAMVANMGNASSFCGASRQPDSGLFSWWAVMMTLASLSLLSWFRFWNRCSTQVSCRFIRRSTQHAGVLALTWVVFPWCGSPMRAQPALAITALFTGMMGLAQLCVERPAAGDMAYVVFAASALWALARGTTSSSLFALLVLLYAFMVLVGGISYWRKATRLIPGQKRGRPARTNAGGGAAGLRTTRNRRPGKSTPRVACSSPLRA